MTLAKESGLDGSKGLSQSEVPGFRGQHRAISKVVNSGEARGDEHHLSDRDPATKILRATNWNTEDRT
jgi:hypothetical protein